MTSRTLIAKKVLTQECYLRMRAVLIQSASNLTVESPGASGLCTPFSLCNSSSLHRVEHG